MVPDRAFFAVQRRFAERWAVVASVPVEDAYLECTTWYHLAAGLGRDFDAGHDTWQRLLAEVAASPDPDAVVHACARAHERPITPGPVLGYSWSAVDREVQLHFIGERCRTGNPLADDQLAERLRLRRDALPRDTESMAGGRGCRVYPYIRADDGRACGLVSRDIRTIYPLTARQAARRSGCRPRPCDGGSAGAEP